MTIKETKIDLASTYPELPAQRHPTKHGNLVPMQVTPGSGKKVWWKCAKGHEWEAVIQSRTRGNGCPYCGNAKVLKGFNDLATTNPELLGEWDYEKNKIKPDMILASTPQKAWWNCKKCGYSWESRINTRSKKDKPTGCPACAGKATIIGINDLVTVHPEIAKEWNYNKNGNIKPENFTSGSGKAVWWIGKCNHEWKTSINNRVKGKGCPYCAHVKMLKGYSDLKTTSPDLIREWNYEKNTDTPDEVSAKSAKNVWWICPAGHEYKMRISHRAEGHGCPYCVGQKPILGENDLKSTNPDIAREWHPIKNGKLRPTDVMRYTEKKVWWLGICGHEWEAPISSRVIGKMGCPICNPTGTSFPEQAVSYYVKQIYPKAINRYKEKGYELDLYIPEKRIGVEYDGAFYHNGKAKLRKDNQKDKFCKENGIQLIRIREDGLTNTETAINIIREKPYLDDTLERAINTLLSIIAPENSQRVDLETDYGKIRNTYIQIEKEKSLAKTYPQIAAEWDNEKNFPLTAYDVSQNTNRKVWWLCEKGHSYQSAVYNRTRRGTRCPYCSGRKAVPGETDLLTQYPELKKEWDYSKNTTVDPNEITHGSGKRVWWKCSKCGYSWKTAVVERTGTRRSGCPVCAKKREK